MVRQKTVVDGDNGILAPEERILLKNYRALGKSGRAHAQGAIATFASIRLNKDKAG